MLPAWKFIKVTQRSRSNLVVILISRTSLPVQLQHGAGKFWCIMIFTGSCKMLPFEHDLVQRSKRSHKSQHQICPRFWCGEYLCKITKGYWQFLRCYRVHKAAWPWASLKVRNSHTKYIELIQDFYVENIHVKLQHDTGNLRKVIVFTRSSQMLPSWKFKKVTQRSRSNLVEILMSRTSLPEQLQHDAGKFWCIILFTRSCKMLPFEHDLFQKVEKVRQMSTSNSPKILMWRISL